MKNIIHLIGVKMSEFFKKNQSNIITIIVLLLGMLGYDVTLGNVINPEVKEVKTSLSEEDIETITEIIDNRLNDNESKVNKQFEDIDDKFDEVIMLSYQDDIDVLAIPVGVLRTGAEVDELVTMWITEGWSVQEGAISRVAEYDPAKEKLRERLYSDEVFQALMTYAK